MKRMIQMFAVILVLVVMSTVVTADMLAYWPLDEGEGDVFYDVSGNAYDGTVGGGNVEWTTSGYINNALDFTFTTEAPYPEAEAQFGTGVLNIEELTCALWVKMSKPFRSWGPLFVLLGEGYDWDIEPDDDGILWIAAFDDPPEEVWWGGGETLDDNEWHHVALTCSNSQDIATLYFDGVAVADTSESFGSGTGTGWPFSDAILGIRLGGPRDRNQWASYGGLLDEVIVYNEPLDAAAITDLYLNGPRVHFKNRFPDYGAINVDTTVVLSWDAPDDYTPTGYDVYLKTDPNELVAEYSSLGQTETTFDPDPDLEYETTYYWQLIVYEPNEAGTGGIPHVSGWWPFTTETLSPYITLQPSSQVVDAGDTAVFTVAGGNTTNYTWKKASDGSVILSGAGATTLTIGNVQLADEDFYYCELTNDIGTVVSDQARLMTRRLVGWWKLDGDATDSVALEIPGAPTHDGILPVDPNFIVDGIDGNGYAFYGDGRVIEVADSSAYFNFYPQGMTVSIWVKTSTTTWDGVIAKHYRPEGGTFLGWLIDVSDDWCHFTVRGSHDDLWGSDDEGTMFDGNWHLITGVMDPATQTSRIYVDGAERNESGVYDMADALLTTEPVVFGAETVIGQIPYTGQIDDVRIYNFVLGAYEIAHLYTDFETEEEVCVENPEFDLSGPQEIPDCRIDIFDLAVLAAGWLECNIVPTCK